MEREIIELSEDIIKTACNSLLVNLRFMDTAINKIKYKPSDIETISINAEYILYNPFYIINSFRKNHSFPSRIILHEILHCILTHFYVDELIDKKYWDISCDIAVENIINDFNLSFLENNEQSSQIMIIDKLRSNIKFLTAKHFYDFFINNQLSEKELEYLQNLFSVDDHEIWYKQNNCNRCAGQSSEEIKASWDKIASSIITDLQTFSKNQEKGTCSFIQNLKSVEREKYDYSNFLTKFSNFNEEALKINEDEFDYVFYTYGLSLYKNMPLIEALEYKEIKKIKEFVIAIDTSGSTSGEIVQKFLTKTYNILTQNENHCKKINIHIIQCDDKIQHDDKITSREEFIKLINNYQIYGGGGTNFCPVFNYVDNMIKNKEFTNLKGVIYFTDGFGEYPARQPKYKTAFVFIDDNLNNYDVPVWAIKQVLKKEQI